MLLEAMAAGKPFGAFDVGGIAEVIPPPLRSLIVPSGDLDAFISRLRELMALPAPERDRLGALLRAHARRFDLPAVAALFKSAVLRIE